MQNLFYMFAVCTTAGSVIMDGACTPCLADSYAAAGETSCTDCPAGSSTSDATGSTSIDACGKLNDKIILLFNVSNKLSLISKENGQYSEIIQMFSNVLPNIEVMINSLLYYNHNFTSTGCVDLS